MSDKKGKACILTLGCKVNQYESEAMAEILSSMGYETVPASQKSDICIVNTCTVTAEADRKSCQMVRRLIQKNPEAVVVVTGCTAQSGTGRIASIEGVSGIVGNASKNEAPMLADRIFSGGKKPAEPIIIKKPLENAEYERMCISGFPRTRQYIKIEDGCENRCAYCAIPDARGPVRSRPADEIVAEAVHLVSCGCSEIVLTGIETASYGRDTVDQTLGKLIRRVSSAVPECRIRLGSVDPRLFTEEFLNEVSGIKTLAPHFHISMQSGSTEVLRRMRRKYTREEALEAVKRIRTHIKDVMLTTDMIVGFPGETDEDFNDTVSFVREARFLMTHVFPYSERRGTPAEGFSGRIPKEERSRRAGILSDAAAEVRASVLKDFADTHETVRVLFETDGNGISTGHTDNFINVTAESGMPLHGRELTVRIAGITDTGLTAVPITEKNTEE